eukprot:EG_transcript_5159
MTPKATSKFFGLRPPNVQKCGGIWQLFWQISNQIEQKAPGIPCETFKEWPELISPSISVSYAEKLRKGKIAGKIAEKNAEIAEKLRKTAENCGNCRKIVAINSPLHCLGGGPRVQ